MNKPLALFLLPLVAVSAVWAQPVSENNSDSLARIEAADREFLATLEDPATAPPPAATFATSAEPVIPASPNASAIEKPAPTPKVSKPTTQRQASAKKSSQKKEPTIRRAIPVVRDYTVRTESRGRVILKHYEFPKAGGRIARVTTTTITPADYDEDDYDDEDDD